MSISIIGHGILTLTGIGIVLKQKKDLRSIWDSDTSKKQSAVGNTIVLF